MTSRIPVFRSSNPEPPDTSTLDARLKAAGLDGDWPDEVDIETFRYMLARQITMYLNTWHGCPEPLCKRHRGCMAPHNRCTNVPDKPFDEAEWDRARVDIRRALDQHIAEAKASGAWKDE